MTAICVYCGSAAGRHPAYSAAAVELAQELARRGLNLVYGGGRVGLMGVVADAALAAGIQVIGVIPEHLLTRELAHPGLTAMHVVSSMHERKALMADLADGFLALPGGFGTLDELCEILTWLQLGIHRKPCGLLNTRGYFDGLLQQFEHSVAEGFLRPEHHSMLLHDSEPGRLLERLLTSQPPQLPKWLPPEGR